MARDKRVKVTNAAEDDFGAAGQRVRKKTPDASYRYHHHNPLWHVISAFLYYVVAPIPAWVVTRIYGMTFVNRAEVRRHGGIYLYGNHCHWTDAIMPYLLAFPRRAYVIAGPTAVSVPFVRHIVPMMGGIPLNSTHEGKARFREAVDDVVRRGCIVGIAPEAHEWPYFNGIRDFPPYSFTYPVRACAPVLGYVVTFRQRRWRKDRRPNLTITVAEPIQPDQWQDIDDPKQFLRDEVHRFMCDTVRELNSYAWIQYDLSSATQGSQNPSSP